MIEIKNTFSGDKCDVFFGIFFSNIVSDDGLVMSEPSNL